jgi:hypothetical protein
MSVNKLLPCIRILLISQQAAWILNLFSKTGHFPTLNFRDGFSGGEGNQDRRLFAT